MVIIVNVRRRRHRSAHNRGIEQLGNKANQNMNYWNPKSTNSLFVSRFLIANMNLS